VPADGHLPFPQSHYFELRINTIFGVVCCLPSLLNKVRAELFGDVERLLKITFSWRLE
jgi:hypothetical protein